MSGCENVMGTQLGAGVGDIFGAGFLQMQGQPCFACTSSLISAFALCLFITTCVIVEQAHCSNPPSLWFGWYTLFFPYCNPGLFWFSVLKSYNQELFPTLFNPVGMVELLFFFFPFSNFAGHTSVFSILLTVTDFVNSLEMPACDVWASLTFLWFMCTVLKKAEEAYYSWKKKNVASLQFFSLS